MHILVGWRQSEWLWFNLLFRMHRISNTQLSSEQRGHGFGITDAVVPLDKTDCRAAFFLGMVVPLVAAYSHAVVAGKALVPAG